MSQIVFLDAGTLADSDLSALQVDHARLQCFDYTSHADIVSRLQHASVAITNKVELTDAIMRQLPALKLICVAATGVNNVDLNAASELGIKVCNVRGYANTAVPQHVMALLLTLTNKVALYHQAAQQGRWSQSRHFCLLDYPLTELAAKTFAVIGYGALGQASARLAAAFGMQVIIAEQPDARTCRPGRVPFYQALAQADVVSLHCPLTAETTRLFNAQVLAAMKPTALLINTARGGLIDETALLQALQNGQLGGAALDVLCQEPPAPDNPLLNAGLANLIITPHMAWATAEARQRMVAQLASHISAYFAGKPLPSL
ncbi:MAG: D-2-hydroxyacid dehydrogenase [Gammaproteobacteria bacterium]|nr:D-2-hydroxyacid dehydrogenase [Gammaproteobacteria bacterium]MBU1554286.1 D-2-hydroxyacid dehydrogenase [Gammaproteobacteria bacterium]MBU2072166.1 D-2-hydroxyacid dehydrogenase [Gammaproteobacteria bacterium]MBU2182028.1 D-2-hydroxyacid dehydrogenase [Gammaproteobacteria bacterium]MBU2203871.1 D-2-hydroxyacid dehydrogenase [Gammaproteobacteria bacterium]